MASWRGLLLVTGLTLGRALYGYISYLPGKQVERVCQHPIELELENASYLACATDPGLEQCRHVMAGDKVILSHKRPRGCLVLHQQMQPSLRWLVDLKVDLNQLNLKQLRSIRGIGPKLASKIAAYQKQVGSVRSLQELRQIPGVTDQVLAVLSKHVYVEGAELLW